MKKAYSSGYRWVSLTHEGVSCKAIARDQLRVQGGRPAADPGSEPLMIYRFALLNDEDSILEFAKSHGLLGVWGRPHCGTSGAEPEEATVVNGAKHADKDAGTMERAYWRCPVPNCSDSEPGAGTDAVNHDMCVQAAGIAGTGPGHEGLEYVCTWEREIRDMRLAIEVWRSLLSGNQADAVRLLSEGVDSSVRVCRRKLPAMPSSVADQRDSVERVSSSPSDSAIQLWMFLEQMINNKLAEHVRFGVRWESTPRNHLEFGEHAGNLVGALWLQFAREVSQPQPRRVSECIECGAPFECDRYSALYCSFRCKTRAARRRAATGKQTS